MLLETRSHYEVSDNHEEPWGDHSGYRLSFACGFDAVIPLAFVPQDRPAEASNALMRSVCPGCGAPTEVVMVLFRKGQPTTP